MSDPPVRYWTGSYSRPGAGGIGLLTIDSEGHLAWERRAGTAEDPSYLLAPASRPGMCYAVDEGASGVVAFSVRSEGRLERLAVASTAGTSPCHLSVVAGGAVLLAACYADGVVSAHQLDERGIPSEGVALPAPPPADNGPHAAQNGPHAHATLEVADSVYVTDLGTDRLQEYRYRNGAFDAVASIALPPGAGPRDLVWHRTGLLLVLGEHDCRVHVIDPGERRVIASVPLTRALHSPGQAAGLTLRGDRLYSGLRGSDRIAVLTVGGDGIPSPLMTTPSGGHWPRHHVVHGGLLHVANERSGTVTSFRLGDEGLPRPTGAPTPVPTPTFLLRVPEPSVLSAELASSRA